MNREIEIINGKLYVPLYGTICVFTVEEASELANQLLSAIAAICPTPFGADAVIKPPSEAEE